MTFTYLFNHHKLPDSTEAKPTQNKYGSCNQAADVETWCILMAISKIVSHSNTISMKAIPIMCQRKKIRLQRKLSVICIANSQITVVRASEGCFFSTKYNE